MSKIKSTPLVAAICLMSSISCHAAAADNAKTEQLIRKINNRTAQLEKEVRQLRAQLVNLKQTEKTTVTKEVVKQEMKPVKNKREQLLAMGATPVLSSPYIGVRSQYDASDLIVNVPYYNQDLQLLQQQQKLQNEFTKKNLTLPSTPVLLLSGKVEGQVSANRNLDGSRSTDTDLSGSEIDLTAHFSPWLTGFIALAYDNDAPFNGAVGGNTVTRTDNSRIFLTKGWLTLGNLNKSPFYATLGQRYHFGQYSSFMVSLPLTLRLNRIKARSLLIGYQHPGDSGLYSTLYTFKGDSNVGTSHINQLGATLGYQFKNNSFTADVGADYVNNIADSAGMQRTGSLVLPGFGATPASENLVYRVPGIAAHGKLGIGPWNFVTEYTGATKRFDFSNVSFNNLGARPRAFNAEGAYVFTVMNKPANVALGYSTTSDALAFNLPKQRYSSAFNISIWKDTIASLEFRRDKNYPITDSAALQTASGTSIGGFTNTLTAQFGVYF